jgi:polysaccharide export outer membrane protein
MVKAPRVWLCFLIMLGMTGCGAWESIPEATPDATSSFTVPEKRIKMSEKSVILAFTPDKEDDYRIWDGDQVSIEVVGKPELSGQQVVGPDGQVTLGVAGALKIRNMTRDEAAAAVTAALAQYYRHVFTTLRVDSYASNKVTVLGRVEHPGPVQFETPPTLMEILSKAGGFPLLRPQQVLTRCSIIRGEKILWVDVSRLLSGDLTLNVRLQRNDVVYIPDAFDTSVFVMGYVPKPGAYPLTPQMSLLDVLAQAGGPNEDSDRNHIHLIRPDMGVHLEVDLEELLAPDPKKIVALKEGDIIYVPRNGVEKFSYLLRKLSPFTQMLTIGATASAM